MSSNTKLMKDEECESVHSTKYRGMIGSLLYLTTSRPDIMFSVCLCARFQEAPKTSHLEVVERIFRYIKGTTYLGLRYPKGTGIETVVYANSDHAGDYVDRKRTSGICTFEGCCLTSWFSKKQTALAISSTEVEYVSIEKACQQALIDYDIRLDDVPIMCDNKEFDQILGIPYKGACVFTNKWSLDDLRYSVSTDFPYQTDPLCPDDIKNYIQEEREGPVTRICHRAEIPIEENKILNREIVSTMKPWAEISKKFNLAFFIEKRMEFVTKQVRLILPYGMLLTRLFKYVMSESPELFNESYVLYDRVMYPLTAQQERKTQKDYGTKRGRHFSFSSSAFNQPSSSHLKDDDDAVNDEGTSRASTPSPTHFFNSLTNKVPRVFENPPNVDPDMEQFYTFQTKILNHQVQLRDEHRGGLRSFGKGIKNLWRNMKNNEQFGQLL
nr:retrovirus-related Pol polyprotein from transposon TNT 1-94 [Tanacetum cinerariifolium]